MAGNLNKVMIIGHLGRDPEVRYTKDGTPVANLSVATSEQWRDRNGERQERTEWHRCVLWGKQAEIAERFLAKGRLIYVEGRLETRKWQDQNGQDRYSTEIRAFNFQMLDRQGDGGGGGGGGGAAGGGGRSGGGGGGGWGGGGGRGRDSGPPDDRDAGRPPDDDDYGPPPDEDDIPF